MTPPTGTISEEEYLIREPESEYKSEYRDGRMVAMGGASVSHSRITVNLIRQIDGQLKGGACTTYSSDTRIKVAAAHFYTYPDLSVVCGKATVDAKDNCAILNPTLIVEVLSPSTESYDRGQKFEFYKKLESLREYLIVAQDRIDVERYSRQESGEWEAVSVQTLDGVVDLPAIGCRLAIRDIYDKVDIGS